MTFITESRVDIEQDSDDYHPAENPIIIINLNHLIRTG